MYFALYAIIETDTKKMTNDVASDLLTEFSSDSTLYQNESS